MATINDVRLDKPVEFLGYLVEGVHSRPVDGCEYVMSADDAQTFADSLKEKNEQLLIEETLQGLCERTDGTKLKTAFPTMSDFKAVVTNLESFPRALLDLLPVWESKGVNEVTISFEEK
ncbi:hypothetical protein G3489_19340 [Shewanella baltica]|uniref:hypothetical protein n=1 Tax=Shewanella baltica TaxID=62322 RepID=UPI00217EE939|nr:hypothetical protein [Shewanella baltica]MCS6271831.1 hypothetical protein [Shewanella baltica]